MNPAAPVTRIGVDISNNILSYKKQIRVAERVHRLLPQLIPVQELLFAHPGQSKLRLAETILFRH
jgi:hypothetical protein